MFSNLCLAAATLLVVSFMHAVAVAPAQTAIHLGLFTSQQLTDVSQ